MNLWLIAHKARGEPAFDVATQVQCPECKGSGENHIQEPYGCIECDGNGHWWIVPTSGHRAYPYWTHDLDDMYDEATSHILYGVPTMPSDLPDHYATRAAPAISRASIRDLLSLPPKPTIRRRL